MTRPEGLDPVLDRLEACLAGEPTDPDATEKVPVLVTDLRKILYRIAKASELLEGTEEATRAHVMAILDGYA